MGWHIYLTIILEIMHFSVNELKRCLITLHLSLNDLLRRSVDLMCSAYTNHNQTRTIRRNRNSNKIVLSGSCVFRTTVLSKAAATFVLNLTVSLVSCLTSSVKKLLCKMNYFNWVMCRWSGTRLLLCFFYFICHSYILFIIKCN